MIKKFNLLFLFFLSSFLFSQNKSIEKTESYVSFLEKKKIGLVVNQNSKIKKKHLIDSLINLGFNVKAIFAPEHGFKINFGAGEKIKNDFYRNIPIYSLYGDNKKPSYELMKDLDVMLFDIQDVGVRFYTYISTLHYVMESCAENNVSLIVLDRDNLNSNYVDGPVLNSNFKSFVGMHKVPVLYGMTIGEYALMINGEKWLSDSLICDLRVIAFSEKLDYFSSKSIDFEPPSPNLKSHLSIKLYPTLCFFEGTVVSVGRGTDFPFQILGAPHYKDKILENKVNSIFNNVNIERCSFLPVSRNESKNPKFKNTECFGVKFVLSNKKTSLSDFTSSPLDINIIIQFYQNFPNKNIFFNSFFDKLAGNSSFQKKIKSGWSAEEIRYSWKQDIDDFLNIRKKYLLYPRD